MQRFLAIFLAVALVRAAGAAERLVVQLNGEWGPQHAGFAVAEAARLYASEGLDVAFRAGGRSLQPLARGEVDLAVEHMAPALFARQNGANLVNIAQILRRPTARIVCAAASGVRTPQDLREQSFQPPSPAERHALDLALSALGVLRPRWAEDAACRLDRAFAPPPQGAAAFALEEMGLGLLEEGVWALHFSLQDPAFAARAVRFLRASLQGWARFARDPQAALAGLDAELRARVSPGAEGVAAALGSGELGRMDEAACLATVRLLMLGWAEPRLEAAPEGAWRDDLRAAAARPANAAPARARGR